jgi:flagella basal body P-ring formation protein FlgA
VGGGAAAFAAALISLISLGPAPRAIAQGDATGAAEIVEPAGELAAPAVVASSDAASVAAAPSAAAASVVEPAGEITAPAAASIAAASAADVADPVSPAIDGATWTLRAHADTAATRVYLRDVADCAGDADLCAEADGVDLGAAPAPGEAQTLAAGRIAQMLRREFPERIPPTLALKGARSVRIASDATALDSRDFEAALRERLARLVPPDAPYAVTLVRAKAAGALKLRAGEVVIDFPALTPEMLASFDWVVKNLSGTKRLAAVLRRADAAGDADSGAAALAHDGGTDVAVTALFAVKVRAPIATHDLPRDERMSAADLEAEWVEVGRNGVRFALRADELVGRVLTRPVAMGETIPLGAVTKELIVHRGQMLRLILRRHGLEIASSARSLGAGAVGDTIELVQPTTKKRLSARIVDAATVVTER